MANIAVRSARAADVRELAQVLSRAFYGDPPFMWMLPDARSRERRARGVFKTILRSHALKYRGVEVATDGGTIAGGAIWLPPGHWLPCAATREQSLAVGGRLPPAPEPEWTTRFSAPAVRGGCCPGSL